jgi:hypothetical protein
MTRLRSIPWTTVLPVVGVRRRYLRRVAVEQPSPIVEVA